jgi:hypothetical protein
MNDFTELTDDLRELGREALGLEPPPAGIRHFLPPIDHEAMKDPPTLGPAWQDAFGHAWKLGWLFDGYSHANRSRYVAKHSTGACLAPDIPDLTIDWFDPDLPVRHGDVGMLAMPWASPEHKAAVSELLGYTDDAYYSGKQIQVRDGKLWACCNDGDWPLTEHMRLCGRLVMVLVPKQKPAAKQ